MESNTQKLIKESRRELSQEGLEMSPAYDILAALHKFLLENPAIEKSFEAVLFEDTRE